MENQWRAEKQSNENWSYIGIWGLAGYVGISCSMQH